MAAKGFIELELLASNERNKVMYNVRPELISMYRVEDGKLLVWFDPQDSPFIATMELEDLENELQRSQLNF